jgi:proteasome accessory factor B
VEVDVGSVDGLAREIAGYGPDALVLEPDSLRSDVMARLTAQAGVSS